LIAIKWLIGIAMAVTARWRARDADGPGTLTGQGR
jgi:hypothetical protein